MIITVPFVLLFLGIGWRSKILGIALSGKTISYVSVQVILVKLFARKCRRKIKLQLLIRYLHFVSNIIAFILQCILWKPILCYKWKSRRKIKENCFTQTKLISQCSPYGNINKKPFSLRFHSNFHQKFKIISSGKYMLSFAVSRNFWGKCSDNRQKLIHAFRVKRSEYEPMKTLHSRLNWKIVFYKNKVSICSH